jgi:hypothetical protein
MSENLPATVNIDHAAVLRAVNLNASDPKAQSLLLICDRYGLDPLLKHVVLIQGSIYVTRDGLLAVAHRSGQLDGIVVDEQGSDQTHHVATVSVYRKDMRHPFKYVGRYPKSGGNKAYGPEMAVKCAEVMALRRAFNVSLCAREEMWDKEADHVPHVPETGEVIEAVVESISRGLPAPAKVPVAAQGVPFEKWQASACAKLNVNAYHLCGHIFKVGVEKGRFPAKPDGIPDRERRVRDTYDDSEGRLWLREVCTDWMAQRQAEASKPAPDADPAADPDMPDYDDIAELSTNA